MSESDSSGLLEPYSSLEILGEASKVNVEQVKAGEGPSAAAEEPASVERSSDRSSLIAGAKSVDVVLVAGSSSATKKSSKATCIGE